MQAPFADPLSGVDVLKKTLPLVGRESEMQVIRFLLNTVLLDVPTGARALTISGEMGVGKSRLLAEMYAEARDLGLRVLAGCAYATGSTLPYFPFIEALRPVLRSASLEQLHRYTGLAFSRTIDGTNEQTHAFSRASHNTTVQPGTSQTISLVGMPLLAALSRLFPELPHMLGVTIVPEVLSPDLEKFRLLDAVATFLERMALEQPILLGIDNLQWADSASLELTMYLTVRLHSSRVALVGATRPTNPPRMLNEHPETAASGVTTSATAAVTALVELMRQGLLLVLPLGPLSDTAAEQHLHTLLPGLLPENLAQALLARAEGNPFLLEELVRMLTVNRQLVLRGDQWHATRAMGKELPTSIRVAVGQRLQELSKACHELLRVASLFGRTFPLEALLTVEAIIHYVPGTLSESQVLALIEEATQTAIIAIVPAASNDIDQHEYAIDDPYNVHSIGPISASRLASSTYIFCHGIVQEVLSAEVPVYQANILHRAIGEALEQTYAATASVHATELARHYLLGGKKAAALHWSLLAGEGAARQQAHREAIGHFRLVLKFLEEGETSTQAPSLAQLYITLGELWFKLGELEQAAQSFQKALEKLRVGAIIHYAPEIPSGGQITLGAGVTVKGNAPHSEHPQEVSLQLAQVNRLIADVYRMQGKYDLALAYLQAARTALDEDSLEGTAPGQEAIVTSWFPGRSFPGSKSVLTLEHVSTAERILLLQAQATLDILLFRSKEAETALWQSHQLATEIGDRGSQAFAFHMVGYLRGWGESIFEAIRLQEQARELYIAIGDPFRTVLVDQGLSMIYLAIGEVERAQLYTQRGFERARRYGVRYALGWLHWNSAVLALARGDWSSSTSSLLEAMHEAEATNNTRLKPLIMQAQAELSFRQGHWQQAERHFQAAIQVSANTEWYASTPALYGHFLAVTGRRAAARIQLDRAAAYPEPPGYGGDFYIPFLAEGYLHLEEHEKAAAYIERIRGLRGFLYYGNSVDRMLGVVAMQAQDWEMAEQAFENGLTLCRRARNQPEEAAILYEQARSVLMQSRVQRGQTLPDQQQSIQRVHSLCDQARVLFHQYAMQRAVAQVDTLQEGVRLLGHHHDSKPTSKENKPGQIPQVQTPAQVHTQKRDEGAHSEYHLDLSLTKREQEVLRLVAEGHTDREVADILVISPRTVNHHLSNIFVKLDVPGRAAAVAYAIRQGLV